MGTGFRATHEHIAHFTNGEPAYYDRSKGNVLRHPRVIKGARHHQTEKPVELLADLVAVTSPPGGVVFDPFGGSGTTACAAARMGRRSVLSERDADHCATIVARLSQSSLFGGAA